MRMMRLGMLVLVLGAALVLGMQQNSSVVRAESLLQDVPRLDGVSIYFTETNGEASRFDRSETGLSRFAGLLSSLGATMQTLEWRTGFPMDADLIVVAGPATDLAPDQIARLWVYTVRGGRVLLLTNPPVETRNALAARAGLFTLLLADAGIGANDDILLTEVFDTDGDFERPELKFVTSGDLLNPDHPITAGLTGELAFFGARSLITDESIQAFNARTLVSSAGDYYGETRFNIFLRDGVIDFDPEQDTPRVSQPIAAVSENGRTGGRLVVVGDREFATNGGGLRTSPSNSAGFVFPDNARFLLNAITWLLDVEAVTIDFPTPAPTATPTLVPTAAPATATSATPEPEATPEAPAGS